MKAMVFSQSSPAKEAISFQDFFIVLINLFGRLNYAPSEYSKSLFPIFYLCVIQHVKSTPSGTNLSTSWPFGLIN